MFRCVVTCRKSEVLERLWVSWRDTPPSRQSLPQIGLKSPRYMTNTAGYLVCKHQMKLQWEKCKSDEVNSKTTEGTFLWEFKASRIQNKQSSYMINDLSVIQSVLGKSQLRLHCCLAFKMHCCESPEKMHFNRTNNNTNYFAYESGNTFHILRNNYSCSIWSDRFCANEFKNGALGVETKLQCGW